jgi:hypothetical protein
MLAGQSRGAERGRNRERLERCGREGGSEGRLRIGRKGSERVWKKLEKGIVDVRNGACSKVRIHGEFWLTKMLTAYFQRPNLGEDSHTAAGLGGSDRGHCKGHDRRAVARKNSASQSEALRLAHTLHSRDNNLEGTSAEPAAPRTTIWLTCNLRPSHSSSCPRSTTV